MIFLIYITAILLILTVVAAIADLIGFLYPDWLSPDDPLAEADPSLEDASPTRGTGS